jgi:hypothetical protein
MGRQRSRAINRPFGTECISSRLVKTDKPIAQALLGRTVSPKRRAVETAILKSLNVAIGSIESRAKHRPAAGLSSVLAGINGGISGFFGTQRCRSSCPFTTTLMLRSIADIARHHGEDLSRLEARLACIEVFAIGAGGQNRMDIGYYASRALLSNRCAPGPRRNRRNYH